MEILVSLYDCEGVVLQKVRGDLVPPREAEFQD